MDICADSTLYDVAVVGAGFIGTSAAHHLAKAGQKTVLLEQAGSALNIQTDQSRTFQSLGVEGPWTDECSISLTCASCSGHTEALGPLFGTPHDRGSSVGYQRYVAGVVAPPYIDMFRYSDTFYQQTEQASPDQLKFLTGMLITDKAPSASVKAMVDFLKASGQECSIIPGPEMTAICPDVQFGPETEGIFIKESSCYRSDKMIQILQREFRENGGTIKDIHSVDGIEPAANQPVKLQTSNGTVLAKSVVLAAGPWSGSLLQKLGLELPLQVVAMNTMYYREKVRGQYSIHAKFPCCSILDGTPQGTSTTIFLHPSFDYPGHVLVNVSEAVTVDPEKPALVQGELPSSVALEVTNSAIAKHFPGIHPTPSLVTPSMLTFTPDKLIILDRHPGAENIVFAAGLSGLGFTLAPAVGKALCELVQGQCSSFDLTPFQLKRFSTGRGKDSQQ